MRDLNLEQNPDYIATLKQGPVNRPINAGMSTPMPAVIKRVVAHSFTWDPGSVPAQDETGLIFDMPGVLPGDAVALGIPSSSVNSNKLIYMAWVWGVGSIAVRAFNITTTAIDPGVGNFTFLVFRI